MDQKERAKKDLDKLEKILSIAKDLGFDKKYSKIIEHAQNYQNDAVHFYEAGDYFTCFGAANYAYGHIDALLILEGKRDDHIL